MSVAMISQPLTVKNTFIHLGFDTEDRAMRRRSKTIWDITSSQTMSDMLSACSDSDHEATSSWALSDASSTDCEDTLMTSSWALSDVSTDCEDLSEAPPCLSRSKKDEFLLHGIQFAPEQLVVENTFITTVDHEDEESQLMCRMKSVPSSFRFRNPMMNIRGRVKSLSLDKAGCRHVQEVFSASESVDYRVGLAQELQGHVLEVAMSPHGNFVMQKFIDVLPVDSLDFIFDELLLSAVQLAKNRSGCRIIKRLIGSGHWKVHAVFDIILQNLCEVSTNYYGKFVVQSLLEHAPVELKSILVVSLAAEIRQLAQNACGFQVVGTVLAESTEEHRRLLARALLQDQKLLSAVASRQLTPVRHEGSPRDASSAQSTMGEGILGALAGVEREEARPLLAMAKTRQTSGKWTKQNCRRAKAI